MLGVGSRVSDHLLECHQYYHHLPSLGLGLGFGFCSNKIVHLSSLMLRPPRLRHRMISSSSRHWKSSGEVPVLHNCFSHREGERDHPFRVDGLSSVAGGIVALGKFDALHIGHRELAIQASRVGVPYLLSFVGMVEVLGWEPRAPIVAKCDRERILSSWAPYCRNVTPVEFQIDFSSVRHLTPRQFVEKLSKELRVCGVVAGENYRFGYKASGDASELVRLCKDYGIGAYIINSVMDKNQDSGGENMQDLKEKGQVSSTRVRHALAMGDMIYVKQLLGRPHRLMLRVKDQETLSSTGSKWRFAIPKSCLLNLPPRDGIYDTCLLLVGDENPVFCSVLIDSTHVCLDTGSIDLCNLDGSQEFRLVGIEFGKSN